ncbi:MAG: DinB family protein [Candidatus Thorarchaeota archaeon]|nr:MAG: DinB family protein [Candidatus Thorarchaeota archaeon]
MLQCIEMLLEHNYAVRKTLLHRLGDLDSEEFTRNLGVGQGSVRNILVHLANTEAYWISLLKGEEEQWLKYEDFDNVSAIVESWERIESKTREFLRNLDKKKLQHVSSIRWADRTVSFTITKALVHLATHEAHHRGLLVGLLRQLGYTPPHVDML